MELWPIFLLMALLFAVLGLTTSRRRSGRPASVPADAPRCADVFNEDRVRRELAAFADAPSIVAQFVGRARSGLTKAGERGIVRDWTSFFQEAQTLIGAKTEMERKRSEYLQLANEHEVRAKEKEVAIARHDAELAEENLRRESADYKRQHLEHFIEGGRPPDPKLTPAQQRLLKRTELEQDLQRLKLEEVEALQKAESEPERRRIQNMYAGRRGEISEQLEKNL